MARHGKPSSWNISRARVSRSWDWFFVPGGLIFPLWSGGGTVVRDVLSGFNGNFSGSPGPTWTVGPSGLSVPSTANNKVIVSEANDRLDLGNKMTVFSVWSNSNSGDATGRGIAGRFGTSPNRYFVFWKSSIATDSVCMAGYTGGTTISQAHVEGAGYFDGTPTVHVGQLDVDTVRVWAKKLSGGSVATDSTNPGTLTGATNVDLAIGNYQAAAGGNQWDGKISFLAILPIVANELQVRQFLDDPYGPLTAMRRRAWKAPEVAIEQAALLDGLVLADDYVRHRITRAIMGGG